MSEHIPTGYEHDPLTPERFLLRCPDCEHTEKHRTRPMRGSQKCGSCNRLMGITPISKIPKPDERAEQQRAMTDGGEVIDEPGDFDEFGESQPDTPEPIDWKAQLARTLHVNNDDESHTERDSVRFHPSQLARCNRQALISKFGLEEHDTTTLGVFQVGTLVHEWLEEEMDDRVPGAHVEIPISKEYRRPGYSGLVEVVGTADVYDEHDNVVYDWKTRGGWYKFDPPSERHLDQLTLYMDALDADAGQVVYLNKKNLEVRTWPDGETFAFDPERRDELVNKAFQMRESIKAAGEIESIDDVPAEPCGCWLCSQEGDA